MKDNYFQTWPYVAKLRRWGMPTLCKLIQFLCGLRGHELSKTEWGYGGGDYADRWCRWCNKLIQAPKTSVQFQFKETAYMMKEVQKKD